MPLKRIHTAPHIEQDGGDDIFDTSPYRDKGGLLFSDLPDNLPSFKTPKNARAKEDAISPTTPDESPGLLKVGLHRC